MNAGLIYTFKVDRKTDIGYVLKYQEEEVFLHNNDTNFKELESGDDVEAFLYYDFKGRLAATLEKPIITLGEEAFLEVVSVVNNLGVFLNNGISKDILLSRDDLPFDKEEWPKKGDMILVTLREKGRLVLKRVPSKSIVFKINLNEKDEVQAYVNTIHGEGINVVTLDKQVIFIHKTQTRKKYRLGENINVTILKVYEDVIHGTLIKQKEDMIEKDAKLILDYLKEYKVTSLGNHSSPEDIYKVFNLSKKAFKRALGNLYKQRLIEFDDDKTIYVGDDNE